MAVQLLDARNGPELDHPSGTGGGGTYIIASVPRSGSTLLARLLWDTGWVGSPKEYLNPMQLRDWEVRLGRSPSRWLHGRLHGAAVGAIVGRGWSERRLAGHLERVRCRRSSGGWFGLKLHHHHFVRYGGLSFVDRVLPGARWLRISRRDRLGQAISWQRALESGQWAAWQPTGEPVRYRRSRIQQRLAAIEQAETGWDRALEDRPVWQVTYEALVEDPRATLQSALNWLDVDRLVDEPQLPMRRQADAVTAEWRAHWTAGI